jgi:hypothetical protein
MRFKDITLNTINEGGSSGKTRYNSEVATLCAFCGVKHWDDIRPEQLANPEDTKAQLRYWMVEKKNYDEKLFNEWLVRGKEIYTKIKSHYKGPMPTLYGWVGGANVGPVADVEFHDHELSGVSIKAKGGITLANLGPKSVGLPTPKGVDALQQYVGKEYLEFKKNVFTKVLALAKKQPNKPLNGRYTIAYVPEVDKFLLRHKKTATAGPVVDTLLTGQEIMTLGMKSNSAWQRPIGDWFQDNLAQEFDLMKPLLDKVEVVLLALIEKAIGASDTMKSILRFEDKPYYYASPTKIYYVPSAQEDPELVLKKLTPVKARGTGIIFRAYVSNVDSTSSDYATYDVYLRYRNGLFASNITVAAQNLKNPQNLAWDEVE